MSACYECSLCHQQYSDLDPAMMCCSEDKAQMAGLSGQALMSMSQAIRMEERAAIVEWLRKVAKINPQSPEAKAFVLLLCKAIEAGSHIKETAETFARSGNV